MFVGDTNKLPVLRVFAQAVGFSFRRFLTILRLGLFASAFGALVIFGTIGVVMPEFFEAGSAVALLETASEPQSTHEQPSQVPGTNAASEPDSGTQASNTATTPVPDVATPPQTEDLQELDPALIYILLAWFVTVVLMNAIISAPIMRHITTDNRVPFVPLDRSVLRYLLTGIILVFLYLFFAILFMIGMIVLAATLAILQVSESVFVVVLIGAYFIGYLYVVARLSLIQVDAIAEGSINTLRGWRLTEGNVLRLLLLILLGSILGNLTNALLQGLMQAITYLMPYVEMDIDPALSLFEAYARLIVTSPSSILILGLGIVWIFWSTGFYAAMVSFAWRAIKRTPEEETA